MHQQHVSDCDGVSCRSVAHINCLYDKDSKNWYVSIHIGCQTIEETTKTSEWNMIKIKNRYESYLHGKGYESKDVWYRDRSKKELHFSHRYVIKQNDNSSNLIVNQILPISCGDVVVEQCCNNNNNKRKVIDNSQMEELNKLRKIYKEIHKVDFEDEK